MYFALLPNILSVAMRLQSRIYCQHRYVPNNSLVMKVHSKFYHYWGQRLGYECWEDEQFVREFLRDNEECRIRSHSQKIQVGHGSLDKSSTFWRRPICGTKFRKVYGRVA